MPTSDAELRKLMELFDKNDMDELNRLKAMGDKFKLLGVTQCKLCACTDFIPRILTPHICKRDGCGHAITDHTF
jgi:hypothetical protein